MELSDLISLLGGVALFLFGMTLMGEGLKKVAGSKLELVLYKLSSSPIKGVLLGTGVTAIIQSSSATSVMVVGFVNSGMMKVRQAIGIVLGAITFAVAYPLTMGIAIGAAMPVLLSSLGANTSGKRTAFVYLLIDVLGVVIWGSVFYGVNAAVHFSFLEMSLSSMQIALLNTVFRLATVLVLTPVIGLLEKLVCRLIPNREPTGPEEEDFDRLESRFVQHPALALEQSRQAVNNMAGEAKANLEDAFYLLRDYQEKKFQFILHREDIIDKYEDKLGSYLIQLTGKELTSQQNKEVTKYLHAIGDLERIGDHAMNIAECAKEIQEKNVVFSKEASQELDVLFAAVQEIVYNAITAFSTNDLELAYRVEPLEELIDSLCDEMKLHHVDRLQQGICTLHQGFVFNDLLTNYERVSDHCSNLAGAMIELEADAFDTREVTLNHAMTFQGVNLREDGTPTAWRVENSWGKDKCREGYLVITDRWFDAYVGQVVIHRDYLPDDVVRIWDDPSTPVVEMDPWSPMFGCSD